MMIFYLRKCFSFVLFITLAQVGFCNKINSEILKKEISTYNENSKFDKSILRLDELIHQKDVTNYDLYQLYLLKYLTYKSLLNYPEADVNLNIAEKFGLKDDKHAEEVETRILIERIFIEFDHLRYNKTEELLKKVKSENLKYLDPETYSFYISVLGTIHINNKNYSEAEKDYFKALTILKKESPKHLPNIYRKLIHLYTTTNENKKALEAFDNGIYYAKLYNLKLYILNMYESLTWHYAENENWEKAYKTRLIVNQLATEYDAINQSGKLQNLEKEILSKHKNLEVRNQKNIKFFLGIITIILSLLIIVLYKFNKINQEKRKFVEMENERMRNKLSEIINNQTQNEKKIEIKDYNFSERQLEIIDLVKKGFTNKEIANKLYVSENTIKYHLKIIYNTLGIDSRNSL